MGAARRLLEFHFFLMWWRLKFFKIKVENRDINWKEET